MNFIVSTFKWITALVKIQKGVKLFERQDCLSQLKHDFSLQNFAKLQLSGAELKLFNRMTWQISTFEPIENQMETRKLLLVSA